VLYILPIVYSTILTIILFTALRNSVTRAVTWYDTVWRSYSKVSGRATQ